MFFLATMSFGLHQKGFENLKSQGKVTKGPFFFWCGWFVVWKNRQISVQVIFGLKDVPLFVIQNVPFAQNWILTTAGLATLV